MRGVGYAVGYKNVGFSEGFDDYSTARVRLEVVGGEPVVTVHTAAAEVGQGLVTIEQQICRTELGVEQGRDRARRTPAVGSAGSTSASRQTYVTGGAVKAACERIREQRARSTGPVACAADRGRPAAGGRPGLVRDAEGARADRRVRSATRRIEETVEWRHRPTYPVDPETGQGFAHVQYAFAAHRAVVDVDTDLGLVKVVELDCAQDVGMAMNPQAVVGQIQGGSAQGLGLAIMEEIQVRDGLISEPLVHRLPDPHDPGHAADADRGARVPGPACPLRPARRRRAADDLLGPRRSRRRSAPPPGLTCTRIPIRPEAITGTRP